MFFEILPRSNLQVLKCVLIVDYKHFFISIVSIGLEVSQIFQTEGFLI